MTKPTKALAPAPLLDTKARHHAEITAQLLEALKATDWSLTKAAEALGIPSSTLQTLIATHGLEKVYRDNAKPRGRPTKKAAQP